MSSHTHEFSAAEITHFKEAFKVFDIDGNGSIDHQELKQILTNLGRTPSEQDITQMIQSVDKENTGVVSFESFLLLMWKHRLERIALERYREAFRLLNSSATGFMNAAELRYAMSCIGKRVTDEELDEMIWQADHDGDAKLAYEEFVAIAQRVAYDESIEKRGWETDLTTPTMILWKEFIAALPTILQQGGMAQKCIRPTRPTRVARPLEGEPKVRRVPPDAKSIQPTLSQCREGDVVVLAPGKYNDAIVVNTDNITITGEINEATKPTDKVELAAWYEALRNSVIIESANKAGTVVIQTRFCKVQHMTIYGSGPSAAIAVEQGYPDFVNLAVRGVQGGIAVKNRSFPSITDCVVFDSSKSCGVTIRESRAVIERCTFKGNYDAGILVERSSNPWIDDCVFKEGRGCGIVFLGTSTGVLSRCVVESNNCQGILIQEAANPIIWNNEVVRGKVAGIQVSNKGRGIIVENRFENNTNTDIEISEEANPSVQKNKFKGGQRVAVTIKEKGAGLIDGNEIADYGMFFIHVANGNQIVVQNNKIRITKGTPEGRTAIYISDGTTGRVSDNRIIGWPPGFHSGGAPLQVMNCSDGFKVGNNVIRKTDQEAETEKIANLFGTAYVPGQGRRRTLK
jgi:parallel beta-helix repeat protein